ncbi:hypothetical protein RIF29_15016 [Crotalaria pallida]|uniref:Uncharacterized protein n=1 Tax=Crotalaria pallida TaxID=3830 RepID=A0AAN9FL53_CROPI
MKPYSSFLVCSCRHPPPEHAVVALFPSQRAGAATKSINTAFISLLSGPCTRSHVLLPVAISDSLPPWDRRRWSRCAAATRRQSSRSLSLVLTSSLSLTNRKPQISDCHGCCLYPVCLRLPLSFIGLAAATVGEDSQIAVVTLEESHRLLLLPVAAVTTSNEIATSGAILVGNHRPSPCHLCVSMFHED